MALLIAVLTCSAAEEVRIPGFSSYTEVKSGMVLLQGRPWNTFTHALHRRTLQAGAEVILLELTEHEKEADFSVCRDQVRAALAPLTVNVEYTDIYDSVMRPCQKPLSWFGRNL
jgi:hypothetical protein